MRIHVVSDLHQEFGEVPLPKVDCDCVVLAGDVSTKTNGLKWILREIPDVPVIYICGNHEFYGENYPSLFGKLRTLSQGTNVHFLENESATIQGVRFFGCTLWTDMALMGGWMDGAAEAGPAMNDYKRVRNSARGYKHLAPRETRLAHMASVEALRSFLSSGPPESSVVVTHHAPSLISLPAHRRTEPISCAYASHLDSLIQEFQPQLWVHGHIHHSNDYMIGSTRILANPRAYPDKPNQGFIPDLVVEIPSD
ncbi:metallophosphoesterase [Prosthecobacter fluviatilis]|uniref:Metallophosphoesterase n=1 Tax=Prosthecobacter fluviatilis TaxID=445931 RepID=A0ABW0KTE6_9BACT